MVNSGTGHLGLGMVRRRPHCGTDDDTTPAASGLRGIPGPGMSRWTGWRLFVLAIRRRPVFDSE